MPFERQLTFKLDSDAEARIVLNYIDATKSEIYAGTINHSAKVGFGTDGNETVSLSVVTVLGDKGLCIAGCLGRAIAGPLLQCVLRAKTVNDIEQCMKERAIAILGDAALCVLECLNN